jgi:predicted nucleotidyltransferase
MNHLPKDVQLFFKNMSDFVNSELIFYGSVTRNDYIHNQSDIDLAIFTPNPQNVVVQLSHFLKIDKKQFKKIVWKLNGDTIVGYKIKCNEFLDLNCEIAIYNEIFKSTLLDEFKRPDDLPLYLYIALLIIKFFYYRIPIIPTNIYVKLKRLIYNDLMGKKDSLFMLLE